MSQGVIVGLLASLLTLASPAAVVYAGIPVGGMSATQLNDAFGVYGDTSGRWNGGDSTASVPLPDGRVAWLFSDTFLGPINADGTRPTTSPMVHNSIVLQDGAQLVDTRTGESPTFPTSLVGGDRDGEADNAGYWVADGTVEGATLKVLYNHYRKTGSGSLDIEMTGTWLATFDLPALSLRSLTDLQLGGQIAWGSAILEDGAYTYVYGAEFASTMKFVHLARVPAGGLAGPWEYWTGSAWSAQSTDSARIMSGVGTAYAVQKIGNQYVLVTMEGNLVFNQTVVAYTAASPNGPFAGPINLYTAPEPQPGRSVITYDTRIHAELARPGKLLFSYNVNTLEPNGNYGDARLYRPRFVELDWPLPTPDPETLPAAPTDVSATVGDEGVVHLSWTGAAGATRYWLYQRDLTVGQTHVARIPGGVTGTSADLETLTTDHTYEFSVAAENANGEGTRSAVVSVTPTIPVPSPPTGVTATADTTGKITVSWALVPRAWSYQVYRRDVTAGQTTFDGMSKADGSTTSQDLDWLNNDHEYELYVVAENGGGQSAPSAMVRVTVHYDLPAAPTGLTATSKPDGTIALAWSAPGEGLWFNVYQRDLTEGETEYTQLPLPITSGTAMNAGFLTHEHLYEFAVTATNGGGESPKSAPASATARYPLPPAPQNLRATPGDGQVILTWDETAPDDWYWVYQRDVTAGETEFTRLPIPISQGTTMPAGYLTNTHVYEFKVSAIGSGAEGPASAPVQATPNVPLPGKPTGLTATANPDGTITLNWSTPTANVYHWIYQRDVTAGAAWQKLPYPLTEGTSFTANYLIHGHTYEFKVAANNTAGDGPTSDVATAVCRYSPPPAPTGLRGSTDGDGAIDLNWNAVAPGLYYWVYYRDVTAGEAFIKSGYPTNQTSASWGMLKNGHVYEFKVTAENSGGEGPASSTIRVTAYGGLPAAPTNLSATAGDGRVTLRWTASTTSNVYYWIEYRPSGGTWQRLPSPLSTCCTFNVDFLNNGTTYDFRVRATNVSGDSSASNVASARPMPPIPAAPSGLTASAGDGKVTLQWSASSTSNVYYWIEYRAAGGSWQRLKYPVSTCCTFTVGYLLNGTTYDFRDLSGDSAASNTATARPMPPFPQPPSNLTVSPGLGKATLHWSASSTANVYYWIEYRPGGGSWHRLPYPVSVCCTFTVNYLTAGSYEFRVRATNVAGDSAASNTVGVTMPRPPAPTGVSVSQAGPYKAKLTWNPVAGADSYIIYHGVSNAIWDFPSMKPLPYPLMGGDTSSFTASYLIQPGIHFWAVAAVKYGRVGPMSSSDTMSPLMENPNYYEARYRYFDGPDPSGGFKMYEPSRRTSVDGGIIVARAFIAPTDIYGPISDARSFSPMPYASARIHAAWDTGRGQLGALVQRSCIFGVCHSPLGLVFAPSSAPDTQRVDWNYVWDEPSGGDYLTWYWKATNSDTNYLWKLGWHIDAKIHAYRSSGSRFAADMYVDHFPSYEIYQYPHYTTNGVPEVIRWPRAANTRSRVLPTAPADDGGVRSGGPEGSHPPGLSARRSLNPRSPANGSALTGASRRIRGEKVSRGSDQSRTPPPRRPGPGRAGGGCPRRPADPGCRPAAAGP
jgi:fibronectin type 3 domain-containing protein